MSSSSSSSSSFASPPPPPPPPRRSRPHDDGKEGNASTLPPSSVPDVSSLSLDSLSEETASFIRYAQRGHMEEVVGYLQGVASGEEEACVDLSASDIRGNSALHYASAGGHVEVVTALLEDVSHPTRVVIDAQNLAGDTALHQAAWRDRLDVVRALVDAGADAGIVNADGKTPSDLAQSDEVRRLLSAARNSSRLGALRASGVSTTTDENAEESSSSSDEGDEDEEE